MSVTVDDITALALRLDGLLPEPEKSILAALVLGADFVEAALTAKDAGLGREALVNAIEGALRAASDAKMKAELGS